MFSSSWGFWAGNIKRLTAAGEAMSEDNPFRASLPRHVNGTKVDASACTDATCKNIQIHAGKIMPKIDKVLEGRETQYFSKEMIYF